MEISSQFMQILKIYMNFFILISDREKITKYSNFVNWKHHVASYFQGTILYTWILQAHMRMIKSVIFGKKKSVPSIPLFWI